MSRGKKLMVMLLACALVFSGCGPGAGEQPEGMSGGRESGDAAKTEETAGEGLQPGDKTEAGDPEAVSAEDGESENADGDAADDGAAGSAAENAAERENADREADGGAAGGGNAAGTDGTEESGSADAVGGDPASEPAREEEVLELLDAYARKCMEQEPCLFDYYEENHCVYREDAGSGYGPGDISETVRKEDQGYDGILTMAIADFDRDGQMELLAVRLASSTETADPAGEYLVTTASAFMYEVRDGQVEEAASALIGSSFGRLRMVYDRCRIDCFVKNVGRYLIGYETKGATWMTADGSAWNFCVVEYRDDRFYILGNREFAGSLWDAGEEETYVELVKRLGFDVRYILDESEENAADADSFFHAPITAQDPQVVRLACINRETEAEAWTYTQMQPGDSEVIGYTKMKNYIDADDLVLFKAADGISAGNNR